MKPSQHVLVETNWVVDFVAPALSRNPGAAELIERGRRGELALHVPAISLSEAHKVVRERSMRADLENVRAFVRDTREAGGMDETAANAVFELLSRFQTHVATEKSEAPKRIAALLHNRDIDVFALDEDMLRRSLQIAAETGLELQSFDLSILAAVLVRGHALRAAGEQVSFCTLDAHLQPWDKNGVRKRELAELFDAAGIRVFGDFTVDSQPAAS